MELLERILLITAMIFAAKMLLIMSFLLVVAVFTVLLRPKTVAEVFSDLAAIRNDPANEGWLTALCYPGFWALSLHRLVAHPLYKIGLRTLARLVNFLARFLTACDIHPGAQFGRGIFIDHAIGTVIGETAIVGDNVTMLHQVTLGGTGKETGKRHPTVEDGVLLSAGSKVLGNIVIGRDSKIGAGSVVVKAVPPESTVVGVPGRVVASGGKKLPSKTLDTTTLPDPVVEKLMQLQEEIGMWEKDKKSEPAGKADVLAEIVAYKQTEVAAASKAKSIDVLRAEAGKRGASRSFFNALSKPGVNLIAEVKKASPSGGLLRADFDPVVIAKTYQDAGASALSVLTDEKYFQGSLEYLAAVRAATHLPILRKDFTIDEYQIVEAARAGADAVLLIAACLTDRQLRRFREAAEGEGLDALVEVHGEEELLRARRSGAKIVGINNRNLRTLLTDLDTTFRLLGSWRKDERNGSLLVSESGIKSADQIQMLQRVGVNAVLIGETFMRAPDIGGKVRELMSGVEAAGYDI